MKFARYLEDNCTPEWKRAYIDYRRLKKSIKVIQKRQSAQSPAIPPSTSNNNPNDPPRNPDVELTAESSGNGNGNGSGEGEGEGDDDSSDYGPSRGLGTGLGQGVERPEAARLGGRGGGMGMGRWWDRRRGPAGVGGSSNASPSPSLGPAGPSRISGGGGGSGNVSAVEAESSGAGTQATGKNKGYGSIGFSPPIRSKPSSSSSVNNLNTNSDNDTETLPQLGQKTPASATNLNQEPVASASPMRPPELHLPDASIDDIEPNERGDGSGNWEGEAILGGEGDTEHTPPNSASTNAAGGIGSERRFLRPERSVSMPISRSNSGNRSSGNETSSRRSPSHRRNDPNPNPNRSKESLTRLSTVSTRQSSSGDEDVNFNSPVSRSPRLVAAAGKEKVKSPRLLAQGLGRLGRRGSKGSPKVLGMGGRDGGMGSDLQRGASRTESRKQIDGLKAGDEATSAGPTPDPDTFALRVRSRRGTTLPPARYPTSLPQLLAQCYPDEKKFFDILDDELDKVESFYHDRFTDAMRKSGELTRQLNELAEHRRVFHEAEEERAVNGPVRKFVVAPLEGVQRRIPFVQDLVNVGGGHGNGNGHGHGNGNGHADGKAPVTAGSGKAPPEKGALDVPNGGASGPQSRSQSHSRTRQLDNRSFDPEKYQRYKKKLKMAVIEFYKELEILKNYRILNITGFKKALKKFEKTARIRCIDLYMDERVAKTSFADGKKLDELLKDVEDEFSTRFESGNHKKAVGRLRGQFAVKTHHTSTFLSGTYIGVGLPVMILGLVEALRTSAQREMPQMGALLQVYAALFLPVLFGMLIELNLSAYVAARINYTFIMEIDIRTAIDHRQFLEIPALLFAVLAYCFFFSMYQVGAPAISPFAWPAVWIVFTGAFFLNPVPIYFQHARYWLLSVLSRVFTPGYSRVEFIAFFVADELNSLSYSMGNLWFIGCLYNKGWPADSFGACSPNHNWVYGLLLALPPLIRFIQCVKRYVDSGLRIHLINAGKYVASMLQLGLFVYWRSEGSHTHNMSFAVWATFATINSIYTSTWDLTIDWGLLRPHSGFLRESLGYPSIRPYYYVAMISNIVVRFIWVWYIPYSTRWVRLRSFAFATMEMLRRWQWNFFRVETEQVGNTDQYRVTREVPLPYHVIPEEDMDEDEVMSRKSRRRKDGHLSLRTLAIALGDWRTRTFRAQHDAPDRDFNAGPRGDDEHREYEPRAPPPFERDSESDEMTGLPRGKRSTEREEV